MCPEPPRPSAPACPVGEVVSEAAKLGMTTMNAKAVAMGAAAILAR